MLSTWNHNTDENPRPLNWISQNNGAAREAHIALGKARRRRLVCLSGRDQRIWSRVGKVGGCSVSSEAVDERADAQ